MRFKIGKLWVSIDNIAVLVVTMRPKFITVDYFSYYKTLQLFTSITKQKLSTKVIKIVSLGGLGLSMLIRDMTSLGGQTSWAKMTSHRRKLTALACHPTKFVNKAE